MKKLFVAAVVALLATPLFAGDFTMDAKLGYVRTEGSGNGFVVGPAAYYSLYKGEDFVKDFSVGLGLDFNYIKAAGSWAYGISVGPEARLEMPYSYAKLGFGYNYADGAGSALGMKFSVAGIMEIAEGVNAGLDFAFNYRLTNGTMWSIAIGPVFCFAL